MEKKVKDLTYLDLFRPEHRNAEGGEERLAKALKDLETQDNMDKFANAISAEWKKTDENVETLRIAFSESDKKKHDA